MGNPVATRTRATESSAPVAARPESVSETPESVTVVPPVYMATAESLESISPNSSSVSADQAGYYESVSADLSTASIPESVSSPVTPPAPTESTDGGTATSSATEEETAEESSGGDTEALESEGAAADATATEITHTDTGADTGESEGASGEGATAESEAANSETGGGEEDEGIEAVVTKLPRMAPIRTPWVGSPPPQAIQRRDEIVKRTGSPPELHHAQVRQAVEHVAQAARDAQRRMVWQLGNVAKDTRISIEDMATEILKATSAAIGQINAAIETAIMDVGMVAEDEVNHIEEHGVLTGEDLQRSRDDTTVQLQTYLTQGSADIEALNEVARGRFDNYLGQAEAKVFAIPDTGAVGRIPAPPAASAAAPAADAPHVPQEGERSSDYQLIEHAQEALVSFIDTQSTTAASAVGSPSDNTKNYFSLRATPVMEGMSDRTHTTLVENAQQSAENLSNDATRAQFNILLLGLTTPISEHHEQDQSGTVDANERAIRAQMTEGEYAVRQASLTIYEKRDQAAEYLDLDLRQNLTENIQKTGSKAYKSMMEQAASAEVALNSSAAPMAEGYRDLVDRLNVLVPPGQFLDSRNLVPKLIAARDSAEKMQRSHVEAGEQQSLQTVAQMQEVKKEQVDGIRKAGQESADSVQDVVTQTSFDMSMFSSQMTGHLSEGAINGMAAAQEYAAKVAGDILKSVNGTEGAGLNRIDSVAVGFLNGNIGAAEQSQFHTLAAFVEQMEQARNGPLVQPMVLARENLESRSTELDNKMPERSTTTAIGVGLISPIALGVYLYHTDASESGVIQQLGNLMWPGVLSLEEVFRGQGHGDLQGRIRDRLGDPEKGQALRLFSTSANERAEARLEIANGSTAWFSGVNREARDSVLQGMSSEERGSLSESQITSTRVHLQSELSGSTEELSVAYLDGNREAAAAARTHEALDKAQGQGEWGWIFSAESARQRSDQARVDAMAGMDDTLRSELLIETAFVDQRVIDTRRDQVFREFASLTDPNRRAASSFTLEEARGAMIGYATRSHNAAVIGLNPIGLLAPVPGAGVQVSVERVDMGGDARQYIEDVVNHGTNSTEARNSRGVFEFNRGEADSGGLGISSSTQVRLTNAFENRDLARLEREAREATTPEARSRAERLLAEERGRHRERMQAMAGRLGAPEDVANDPARAEAWMAQRMGGLFATTDTMSQAVGLSDSPSHARYGQEMITGGRASLDAGVALASDGWGTNNDLLRSTYGDRSHAEIRAANTRWASEHGGENMEEMLGIRQRDWTASDTALMALSPAAWFATRGSETSGDLAMELEVLAQGNPETDLDHINIANLRYRQQRERGTGFISEHTMNGSDEQQYLDGSRERMARTILTEAGRNNPELLARFGDNPSAIFNPDGSINSEVTQAAFENGEFRGNSSQLQYMSNNIGYAADAYKAEIDRQEAMLTSGITILALVVSLALMLVPGVNIVAAGMITAIVAGAATMAVKLGMRGGRYGWEEAATDVAQTAIEVATAGIGGAMAGGLGKTGMLARLGETMISRMGRVGGAIAREAIMGAISTAAQTAIQDEVWNDGLARGLQKVANGAIRGAAVSAVTTGISEGITARLNRPINPEIGNLTRMDQVAGRLGPHGAEMFREGLTNTLGNIAGESVGVLIDYSQGNFHGTFGDALKHIGLSGLREMVTSSLRGGITSMNRAHYHALLEAARNGGTLNESQLKALRAFGISSGELHYDQSLEHVRHEVELGRNLLARVPPALREHLHGTDVESLKQLIGVLAHGSTADIGNAQSENGKFLMGLAEKIPGLNTEQLFAAVSGIINVRSPDQATAGLDAVQQHQLRSQLVANLDENIRGSLDKVPLEGMQHLSELELSHAAAMIARGQFDSAMADQLMQSAKARNPHLDEFSFLNNLHTAVTHSADVQQRMFKAAMERRQEVVALVPPEAARVFAQMGDNDIEQAQKLICSGNPGTPHERDALFHAALKPNPELTREQFHAFMEAAAMRVREQLHAQAQTKRTAREERMTHMPEELRSTLSALPEAALVELRLRQMEGNLSPAEKIRLLEMAQRETPGVDLNVLGHALEQAVQHAPTHLPSDAETAAMRTQLLSAIPADQQALIAATKIMVLPQDEFIAFTRSQKGQAVTLIINGEPVVIVREGANPRVLREEGIHALQAHDPSWANHIGSLDEHYLSQWDSLPLEQQIALYRNKVALELDAQSRMIHSLESDIANATGAEKHALQQQLAQVRGAFENLSRRNAEVRGIDAADIHNIKSGFSETPQWLEQPARLFNKDDDPNILPLIGGDGTEKAANDNIEKAANDNTGYHPDDAEFAYLHAFAKGDPDIEQTIRTLVSAEENPQEFAQRFKDVMSGLSDAQQIALLRSPLAEQQALLVTLHGLQLSQDGQDFHLLMAFVTRSGTFNVIEINNFLHAHAMTSASGSVLEVKHYARNILLNELTNGLKPGDAADLSWRKKAAQLDVQSLIALTNIHPDSRKMRTALNAAIDSGNPKVFIDQMRHISAKIGAEGAQIIFTNKDSAKLLVSLAKSGELARLEYIIHHCASVEQLRDILNRLGDTPNPAALTRHLTNVLSTLTTEQSFQFVARIAKMEYENVRDHVEVFSHLVNNIQDESKIQNLMRIASKLDAGEYRLFTFKLNEMSAMLIPNLDRNLNPHEKGKMLSRIVEMAITQKQKNVMFDSAHEFLTIMNRLPQTADNLAAIQKVMRYFLRADSDPAHLAADLNAAVKMLRDPKTQEQIFLGQVRRLEGKDGRLAGEDAWKSYIENEALKWNDFRNNDPVNKDFASLIEAATPGWSDGERAAVVGSRVWFEHLAKTFSIDPADTAGRAKLLAQILDRGFEGVTTRNLHSEGKLTSLERAFREMAVEAHLNLSLDDQARLHPKRVEQALKLLGITPAELDARDDAPLLKKHIYDLVVRQEFYETMAAINKSIGGDARGIQQNITEVIGEIALTQHMLKNEPGFLLATPFGKGTGFDQVWVKYSGTEVVEYVIGEAKGPGAKLGSPGKGAQMSAEWVFHTIQEMMASSDANTRELGNDMMTAINKSKEDPAAPPIVIRGVVIQAGALKPLSSKETGESGYDFTPFL